MNLKNFLSLISTFFGIIGSIYVLRNLVHQTPAITERISASIYGHNSDLIDFLAQQKAEGIIGSFFVIIAGATTGINQFLLSRPPIFLTFCDGFLTALFFTFILFVLMHITGNKIENIHKKEVVEIILRRDFGSCKSVTKISQSTYLSIKFLSEKYLHIIQGQGERNSSYMSRVARKIGYPIKFIES